MKIYTKFNFNKPETFDLIRVLTQQNWIVDDWNKNFITFSFELSPCGHKGPCKPKDSLMSGMHCSECAGWHGEHNPGCEPGKLPGEISYDITPHR